MQEAITAMATRPMQLATYFCTGGLRVCVVSGVLLVVCASGRIAAGCVCQGQTLGKIDGDAGDIL